MTILNWKEKTWQWILNGQIIYLLLAFVLSFIHEHNPQVAIQCVIVIALLLLNVFQDKNERLKVLTTWLNIVLLPSAFANIWSVTGNFLLYNFSVIQTGIVLIMWIFYIILLVPLVVVSVKYVHNWFLRLIAFYFLDSALYSNYMILNIKHAPILHTFNDQGVIAAFALFAVVCVMAYEWGYNLNPNLKFRPSVNFNWGVMITLIILLGIDVWWNSFGGNGDTVWSILFSTDISKFHFTWPNFTSALEPGILEEMERYAWMLILLAGFQRFPKWRIPIAVYGSTLFFALSHLTNIGWQGQSLAGTISQVIAVTDAMAWAVAYLYSGKLWLTMITHFLMDWFINLETGWYSTSTFNGDLNAWLTTILPLIFGLVVSLWMMFGKRRQVMEENVDRILNIQIQPTNYFGEEFITTYDD